MMLTLDKAIVIGKSGKLSYEEAQKLIVSGCVQLNRRKCTKPWQKLKGGHYFVRISGIGHYDFSVRDNTVVRFKEASE